MELKYSLQIYDWGKIGLKSKVAQLLKAAGGTVDEGKHYAELWLGTHPSGPSYISADNSDEFENLDFWIQKNPSFLGKEVSSKFNAKLPFLLKVLSVNKALSIQMHPSKVRYFTLVGIKIILLESFQLFMVEDTAMSHCILNLFLNNLR